MLKKVTDIVQDEAAGLNTQKNILGIKKGQSPNLMNIKVNFDGSKEKRMGSNTQNSLIIATSAGAGFSPTGAITTNLIAFWKMDESAGDRNDVIGNNDLTDNNSTPSASGIKNKAALFVAANSNYLFRATTSSLETGDIDFSISTWFYLNSTDKTIEQTIISKKDIGTTEVVKDGQTGEDSNLDIISNVPSQGHGAGQEFIPNGAYTIGGFNMKLQKVGAPTGNIQGSIYLGAGNVPSGSPLATSTALTMSALATSSTLIRFPFITPIGISNSNTYFLVVENSGAVTGDGSNFLNVRYFNSDTLGSLNAAKKSDTDTWTTSPTFDLYFQAFNQGVNGSQYEYWLYVNTDQLVTFRVSSSGTVHNGSIQATSFGAVTTSTWYNAVAYHAAGSNVLAVGVNLSMTSAAYTSGVRVGSAPFVVGSVSNGITAFMDGRIDETGFWKKILNTTDRSNLYNGGSGNTFQSSFQGYPWASFDFGAAGTRWLTVSAGTGVYASSNLGVSWTTIGTDRTANYQYFERSKNILVATSEAQDTVVYWDGSGGTTMAVMNTSAPTVKYSVNFQGFLILLNSTTRKRGFFYQDENSQLTGSWANSFDIPSSADDEITAVFILRRRLYVSTRYRIFRVDYIGGNPDWSYTQIKNWGYISRTVKFINIKDVGEVAVGISWDRHIRVFDGSDDKIVSIDIEDDNSYCDFALDKISFAGSGPIISFAETNPNENVYKLCLAIGATSTQTTHFINLEGNSMSFYPYSNMLFNTMVMAESANQQYLIAFDRMGRCHMMDSGNLDGNTTPIDDIYDSNLIYDKSPSESQKGYQTNLFMSNTSSGTIYYKDRVDFSDSFRERQNFVLDGSGGKLMKHISIDIPESYNTYQYRITSSANTRVPWRLNKEEHFLKPQGIGKQN